MWIGDSEKFRQPLQQRAIDLTPQNLPQSSHSSACDPVGSPENEAVPAVNDYWPRPLSGVSFLNGILKIPTIEWGKNVTPHKNFVHFFVNRNPKFDYTT